MLSRAEQVREIVKCGRDPNYFIKNYVKIQHPLKGTIPFKTYPFQDDCIEMFEKHRLNIVLKSRQLGLSTVCAAYAAWMAIFQKDKNVLVIATKLPTAMNFIKKVTHAIKSLPPWLVLPKYETSKQQITFNNGSQIKAIPTSDDAGRSEALSLLIIDEAAFVKNFDDLWAGLWPTVSTGGRAILLSTPNGVGGQYYNLWVEAEAGVNSFNPIKIMWDQHPEHDQKWFENETKNLSRKKISQELLCEFLTSGDTFLQPTELELIRNDITNPIEKAGKDRGVWIWKRPEQGRSYVISADVARGDAKDYSAFHVIDSSSCEVVAEYMGKIPPEQFADLLAEWGTNYNTAFIIPENNTFGYHVCVKLRDSGYKRLYYGTSKGDPFTYVPNDQSEMPGFATSVRTRQLILPKLEELFRNRIIKVHSQRLYDQLQTFVWQGNKASAAKGSNDDLIISLAIGTWLIEGVSSDSSTGAEFTRALLGATSLAKTSSEQVPGVVSNRALLGVSKTGIDPRTVHRPRDHTQVRRNAIGDFSWLYR
jgi:hypothetical protein